MTVSQYVAKMGSIVRVFLLSILFARALPADTSSGPAATTPQQPAATNSSPATAATNAPAAWTGPKELPDSADEAWAKVMAADRVPNPPADWNGREVTDDERRAYKGKVGDAAAHGADLAKEFAGRFPSDPRFNQAKDMRVGLLRAAVRYGVTDREKELAELSETSTGAPPAASPFEVKFRPLFARINAMMATNKIEAMHDYLKGLRVLQKEFPGHPQIFVGLYDCATYLPPDEATVLSTEIVSSTAAPEEIKGRADEMLKRLKMIGKPLDLQFTTTDGHEISATALRGKVVLVDFWATWCGPCIASMPAVKAAYSQYHEKGLEILGINLDEEKDSLTRFVAKNEIPWAQYFDGQGWQNKIAVQYAVHAIPNMWLVDKKGNLRDVDARNELESKIEKLLSEN